MMQFIPRRSRHLLVALALLTGTCIAAPAFAGRLSSTRSGGAHSSSSSSHSSSSSSPSYGGGRARAYPYGSGYGYGYNRGYGYDPYWSWWGFRAFGAPWWVPYAAVDDDYERPYAFPGAPYENGIDGYVRIAGITPALPDATASQHPGQRFLGNSTAVRVATEGSWIDADMQRFGLSLLVSTSSRVEIGTDWSLFTEKVHPGDPDFPNGGTDRLWLGTIDGSFLFAQGPHSQFRTGLGLRVRSGSPVGVSPNELGINLVPGSASGYEYGINFLYGMDFYPVRPLILSMRGDVGNVGDGFIARARASAGAIVGHVELFGGYDNTWYRDQSWGGPVVGLRIWN